MEALPVIVRLLGANPSASTCVWHGTLQENVTCPSADVRPNRSPMAPRTVAPAIGAPELSVTLRVNDAGACAMDKRPEHNHPARIRAQPMQIAAYRGNRSPSKSFAHKNGRQLKTNLAFMIFSSNVRCSFLNNMFPPSAASALNRSLPVLLFLPIRTSQIRPLIVPTRSGDCSCPRRE